MAQHKQFKHWIIASAALFATTSLHAQHLYSPHALNNQVLTDNKMHVYVCGTGVPQMDMQTVRKPACLAVIANQQFILFDAGDGAIQTLASMGLPFLAIQNVFLTHLHSDHMAGLGEVMNGTWHTGRTLPMTVYGPYGVRDVLNGFKKAYRLDVMFRAIGGDGTLNLDLAFAKAQEISADGNGKVVFDQNGLKISAFAVDHLPVFPAFGYRIEYKGCKFVFSGDTQIIDALAKNAKNADVLVNEAVSRPLYDESVKIDAKSNPAELAHADQIYSYHSDSYKLAQMAKEVGVKKLVLTHLLPSIGTTEAMKKAFIAGMDKYFSGPIIVANDGDEIVLSSNGPGSCEVTFVPAMQPNVPLVKTTS